MRILWASNSPHSPSGYGVQTDIVTRRLLREGHQIAIASNFGLDEGILPWHTEHGVITVYPKSMDKFSLEILPLHAQQHNADVILSHYDSWVYRPELMAGRWVPWYPMDTEEYPKPIAEKVSQALMPITQTRDSVEKAAKVGIEAEYIPAAFDGRYYRPRMRDEWRERMDPNGELGLKDRYVVGIVAANRGDPGAPSRKSFPQLFEAFRLFLDKDPDALLYVHSQMFGHINLQMLAEQYGVQNNLLQAHSYYLHTGLYGPDDMATMYSGLDVLLNVSMGEGFGVPVLEAQACGTRVIVGDWTAMAEVGRCGAKVSKQDAFCYPVLGYGDMYLPQPGAIAEALIESTNWTRTPEFVAQSVAEYEIEHVIEHNWKPTLAKLQERLDTLTAPEPPQMNRAQRRATIRSKKKSVAA